MGAGAQTSRVRKAIGSIKSTQWCFQLRSLRKSMASASMANSPSTTGAPRPARGRRQSARAASVASAARAHSARKPSGESESTLIESGGSESIATEAVVQRARTPSSDWLICSVCTSVTGAPETNGAIICRHQAAASSAARAGPTKGAGSTKTASSTPASQPPIPCTLRFQTK